jgi:hypothetical protein
MDEDYLLRVSHNPDMPDEMNTAMLANNPLGLTRIRLNNPSEVSYIVDRIGSSQVKTMRFEHAQCILNRISYKGITTLYKYPMWGKYPDDTDESILDTKGVCIPNIPKDISDSIIQSSNWLREKLTPLGITHTYIDDLIYRHRAGCMGCTYCLWNITIKIYNDTIETIVLHSFLSL